MNSCIMVSKVKLCPVKPCLRNYKLPHREKIEQQQEIQSPRYHEEVTLLGCSIPVSRYEKEVSASSSGFFASACYSLSDSTRSECCGLGLTTKARTFIEPKVFGVYFPTVLNRHTQGNSQAALS